MILTSSYKAWQTSSNAYPISISADRGRDGDIRPAD